MGLSGDGRRARGRGRPEVKASQSLNLVETLGRRKETEGGREGTQGTQGRRGRRKAGSGGREGEPEGRRADNEASEGGGARGMAG